MAAPAVHLIRGLEWLQASGATFDAAAFARGSVFPDIRYLGVISRDRTHDRPYTAAEVLAAPSAFEAGRRHHNLLDAAWNRYFHAFDWGVPREQFYLFAVALKSVEAMMTLETTVDRQSLSKTLDGVDAEAPNDWPVNRTDVARWQALVKADLNAPVSLEAQLEFLDRLKFDPNHIDIVRRHARGIATSNEWRQRIADFGHDFDL